MALISQNRSYSVRDYLFIAAGLLGIYAFFMTYGVQDPRGMIDAKMDQETAVKRANDRARLLGFNTTGYRSEGGFGVNRRLLDSLQHDLGRQSAVELFRQDSAHNLVPFYWNVQLNQIAPGDGEDEITFSNERENVETGVNEFILRFSPSGEWVELINDSYLFPDQRVNKEALRTIDIPNRIFETLESLPDSSWKNRFTINLDQNNNDTTGNDDRLEGPLKLYQLSRSQVLGLSRYYLEQSGWIFEQFEVTNIRVETTQSAEVARIQYRSMEPVRGQQVNLQSAITHTGLLLELRSEYNPTADGGNNTPPIWELVKIASFFLFGIGVITIFYFRIRARVIDTKSALVMSIVAGFIVPVIIFLNQVHETNIFAEGTTWIDFIGLSLSMGIAGAVAAVSFFIISAVGDSITRQHLPDKLESYDYLRQGMFFNKPVGETLVRSVILMFLLAGFWSLLLWFFPHMYLETTEPFLAYEVIWPPVYVLLDNIWYSLIASFGIFLVVGSQAFARTSNRWVAGLFMVLAVGIAEPLPFSGGPVIQQFAILLVIGVVISVLYWFWDFLTLLLTYFLFSILLIVSSGWIVESSPDLYVFISYLLFIIGLVGTGVAFIMKGKEEQALPDYVPEYVEELAQEERIKQELQIARDVQQSFLPIKTPEVSNLDLAAICKPAYETGGDYYDFIQLDDHRLGVAIGDVSGKGIQAAFYMTLTKGILHTLCRETESPAEILKKANKLFYENAQRGTFISLIYGVVDMRDKTFRFARAGHNPIFHFSSQKEKLELLQPGGLGLGLTISDSFDNNIQEKTLQLGEGDLLVLYTDGVVESLNKERKFYGTERLKALLEQGIAKEVDEILSDLVEDVTKFSGEEKQHDDMTIMVIKLNNKS